MTTPDFMELKVALALHKAGQLADAETAYRKVLARIPNEPNALNLLGVVKHQLGKNQEAVELIRRAVAVDEKAPEYYVNLGAALHELERFDEATAAYQKALSLRQNYPKALSNLGNSLRKLGRTRDAIAACHQGLVAQPDSPQAHNNYAAAIEPIQAEQAIVHYQMAISLRADFAEAYCGLASALLGRGRVDEAIAAAHKALELRPTFLEAANNLANALAAKGEVEEAAKILKETLNKSPQFALANWNLGLLNLLRGDYERGWEGYEWRLRVREFRPPVVSNQPLWDGGDLGGRRIVLLAEQARGDVLQFARFIPQVVQRNGRVSVVCHADLLSLIGRMENVESCTAFEKPLPEHDVQFPLLSLGSLQKISLEDVAPRIPYLSADPRRAEVWKARMPADSRPRVGLAWAGKLTPLDRSIPAKLLAPLAEARNVQFFSLQKWPPGSTPAMPPLEMTDMAGEFAVYADTTAMMAHLDLIITIDTSVAHLAGALGKKTWVLLRRAPDWRWMLDREDSPWYPTMRLFRQPAEGDWSSVVARVAEELKKI